MDWVSLIEKIGVIVLGVFAVYQYRINKNTDYKIKRREEQDKRKAERINNNTIDVWGVVHNLLSRTKADRVYIVQPHPLGNEEMLSIHFEVTRQGVRGMRNDIQEMKIASVVQFAKYMKDNLFVYITDIEKQVSDRYARSIMTTHGTKHLIVKRLNDNKNDWCGSIFCEYTNRMKINERDAKELLRQAATNIQYILPPIER